jgi:CRP-like cAMP-binding protein
VATPADLLAFLREVRLFTAFAEADVAALAQRLRERSLRKNQVLFREGDPGDEMFLIHRGTVLVSKIVKARVEQLLNRQSAGEFFGEMSLLDGSPRSATIQAETEETLLALDRKSLNQLIEASPHAAAAFFYAMVLVFMERLRGSDVRLTEATRWGLEATGLDVEPR